MNWTEAGRQEVIDWIREHGDIWESDEHDTDEICINIRDLKEQVKEWGIEWID